MIADNLKTYNYIILNNAKKSPHCYESLRDSAVNFSVALIHLTDF